MSDRIQGKPAVPLERPSLLRPSWPRRLARLAIIGGLGAAIIGRSDNALMDRRHDCAAVAHSESPADAVQVCTAEFQRTDDPATGVRLAGALDASGDVAAAKRVATRLIATSGRSGALQLLGQIANAEGRLEEAVIALEEARKLHGIEQRPSELAGDDGVLAWVRTDRGEFVEALRLIDECIEAAQRAGDLSRQCYCHIIAARTLVQAGYFSAAENELQIAAPLATSDKRRSDLEYQRANYAQESGQHATAAVRFENALRLRKHSPDIIWTINTELNLAYSLAELGKIDDAQHHLQNATVLDADHRKQPERTWVAARIAYRQHDLTRASSLNDKYFTLLGTDGSVDRDDQIEVATLQARIELDRNDLGRAEGWARQAVEQAERVRGAQSALELRPWVLAKRRAPYELRFTALARSGQVEDAAMAFDAWQGRTVQDALARPRPPASLDRRSIADQLARLGPWLGVASPAMFAGRADRAAVLSTMRGIDLVALIVANDEVWSLTANHGPPRISRIAPLAQVQELAGPFRGHPTDAKLASALGALLLPDAAFRATRDVLHVLIDARLGGLPVAALRHGTTPLIAIRPIVRVLRLPETPCVRATRSGHATVLADPGGDLPSARTEAEQVAGLLHTTSKAGSAATKAALFAAADDAVLHVAAHGMFRTDGAAIVLADGDVSALEISARGRAPSLTVLSACDAATSDDSELAGSLAAAFLAAGSTHVVATTGKISDVGAPDISTWFYRAGGVADPARALAAVQSALAKTANEDWPHFTAFGPDVCTDAPPGQ